MLLTGHGIFNEYKIRINKESNNKCWECNEDPDDAEHALYKCPKWTTQRVELENKIGDTLTNKNFINKVLNNEDSWTNFKKLRHDIMKQR
jgi:Zn finger protein HypA/HybF involved in hydrogenase expression